MARFEVIDGPDGRCLVRDGPRRWVVPARLGCRLRERDGASHWRTVVATAPEPAPSRRALWLRVTLVPAPVVRRFAAWGKGLTAGPFLIGLAGLGVVGVLVAPGHPVGGHGSLATALALAVLGAVWHELGHAAALQREGWPPGEVGLGLLWVLPVLWSDVTAVALLPRRGRVRVDVSGVAFQFGYVGMVGLISAVLDWAPGSLAVRASLAMMAWSLLPLVRSDGHWLVCDLLGLADLAAAPPPTITAAGRWGLVAWRAVTMLAIAAVVVMLPWRLALLVLGARDLAGAWALVLLVTLGAVSVLGAWRAARRLLVLARAVARDGPLGP